MATRQQNRNTTYITDDKSVARTRHSRRRAIRKVVATVNLPQIVEEEILCVPQIPIHDLLAAVTSLYNDKLRPYGRLVRKRLGEIAMSRGIPLADGDLNRLKKTCENCLFLTVELGEGSEWSVVLKGQNQSFVDVYSTVDAYPANLWTEIKDHVQKLNKERASLPGGRYSCAKALLDAGLPLLQGRSLGEVCHIVQLAMSEKKFLGYLDGTIACYELSNSMMKDVAAEQCIGSSSSQLPLASWASARSCMVDVLESAVRKGKQQVPISTMKRLFRSRFHLELSETALGHTKLSDLLQDEAFSDICSVKLLERGYVVLPSDVFVRTQKPLSMLKDLPVSHQKKIGKATPRMSWSDCQDEEDSSTEAGSGSISPTLTGSPEWTPRNIDSDMSAWEVEDFMMGCWAPSQQLENDSACMWRMDEIYANPFAMSQCFDMFTDMSSAPCPVGPFTSDFSVNQTCPPSWVPTVPEFQPELTSVLEFQPEPEYLSKSACKGSLVRNTFIEIDAPSLPSASRRSQSVPRSMGCSQKESFDKTFVSQVVESKKQLHLGAAENLQNTTKCVLCLSDFL